LICTSPSRLSQQVESTLEKPGALQHGVCRISTDNLLWSETGSEFAMIKFSYTILYVKDVLQAVAFYESAFGLKRRFVHESGQYAELDTGSTTLSFTANELARTSLPQGFLENSRANLPAGIEIGLVTEDVSAVFAQAVEIGAEAVATPKVKPWGQTVAYVRDLDGVLVEICSPVG
jgi:lactoylglutathione lyase